MCIRDRLYHRDWVSDTRAIGIETGWQPRIGFGDGLVATLAWYHEAGWLGGRKLQG